MERGKTMSDKSRKIEVVVDPVIKNSDTQAEAQFQAQFEAQRQFQAQLQAQEQEQAQFQAQLQAQLQKIFLILKKHHDRNL